MSTSQHNSMQSKMIDLRGWYAWNKTFPIHYICLLYTETYMQNWVTAALIVTKINAFKLTFKLTKMAKWTKNIFSSFYA